MLASPWVRSWVLWFVDFKWGPCRLWHEASARVLPPFSRARRTDEEIKLPPDQTNYANLGSTDVPLPMEPLISVWLLIKVRWIRLDTQRSSLTSSSPSCDLLTIRGSSCNPPTPATLLPRLPESSIQRNPEVLNDSPHFVAAPRGAKNTVKPSSVALVEFPRVPWDSGEFL